MTRRKCTRIGGGVPPHPTRCAARLLRLPAAVRVPQGEKGSCGGRDSHRPFPLSSRPQRSQEPGQRRGWRECRRVGWRRNGCPGSPRCAATAAMTDLGLMGAGARAEPPRKGLCPRFYAGPSNASRQRAMANRRSRKRAGCGSVRPPLEGECGRLATCQDHHVWGSGALRTSAGQERPCHGSSLGRLPGRVQTGMRTGGFGLRTVNSRCAARPGQ